jgi:hypothetical protein
MSITAKTGDPAHQFLRLIRAAARGMLISPSQSTTATAPVPIAVKRLPAACIVVRYSNSKRAGRDSIAAQETFQVVQFLAGTGGLAQPAAEFL